MSRTAPVALVMAKAPVPGRTKTRLHPLLGPQRWADLQAALLTHTMTLTAAQGLRTYVAYDPPDAAAHRAMAHLLPSQVRLLPQAPGNLRQRLTAATDLDTPEDAAALLTDPLLPVPLRPLLTAEEPVWETG
ncbi:hypothetical protein ACFW4X_06105 [Streptomyces smyrnaeus]|uniref:hypothetical protein n=1 Tax=Streptomyces smyrnaeus TaxID=1387713 RepID=UPI0036806AFE